MSKGFSNNFEPNKIMIPSKTTLIPQMRNPFLKTIVENRINKFSIKDTIKNIKKIGVLLNVDLELEDHRIL